MKATRSSITPIRLRLFLTALSATVIVGFHTLSADIVSDFGESDEGWQVIELTDTFGAGPYNKVVRGPTPPTYSKIRGHPVPGLLSVDLPGNSFYFQAPAKFLGDASASYGLTLSYDLSTPPPPPGNWYVEADVILTGTNGTVFAAQVITAPPISWATYSVSLHESKFYRNSLVGAHPSRQEFLAVLSGLKSLWIRGEHFYGTDTAYFDNVRLQQPVPPPVLAIEVSDAVHLTATVTPGATYSVEVSADLFEWLHVTSFKAANETYTAVFDRVGGSGQYYRLKQEP